MEKRGVNPSAKDEMFLFCHACSYNLMAVPAFWYSGRMGAFGMVPGTDRHLFRYVPPIWSFAAVFSRLGADVVLTVDQKDHFDEMLKNFSLVKKMGRTPILIAVNWIELKNKGLNDFLKNAG